MMQQKLKIITIIKPIFILGIFVTFFLLPNSSFATVSTNLNPITVKLGSKSVLVTVIQKTLIKQGYLKSAATGLFDLNTQTALEAFQKAQNLQITGKVALPVNLLTPLFFASAPFLPVKLNATGGNVSSIQKFFIAKGYLKIASPTGLFGSKTQAAVVAFQKVHNLPQTGIIDVPTFAAMNKHVSPTLPTIPLGGCTSSTKFNPTTGAPCSTGTNTFSIPGVIPSWLY